MRTREEITSSSTERYTQDSSSLREVLEVLLDIRDLLANPPITIEGKPMSDKEYRDLFNPPTASV